MSYEQFVQCHDQNKRNHADNQILRQNAHVPAYDKPADGKDNRLMEYVERKHRLVAIGECPVVEIQVLCS